MSIPPIDPAAAHRWFAIECNNRAWDLVEASERTAVETAEMLRTAHAARFHWEHAGQSINALRAEYLLSIAYAAATRGEPASHHAQEALALMGTLDELSPFDRTCIEVAAARAAELLGHAEAAVTHWTVAGESLRLCPEKADQDALLELFPELS